MKKTLYLLLAACLLCSCEGLFGPKETELTLTSDLGVFESSGGSGTVTFSSNKDWIVSMGNDNASSWIKVTPESGKAGEYCTVTVTAQPNENDEERNASFYITSADKYLTINATQKQKDALLVTCDKFELDSKGGSISVTVRSNVEVVCQIGSDAEGWVKAGTKALTNKEFFFTVDANPSLEVREGTLCFTGNAISEIVKIYQQGETPTLVLSPKTQNIPTEGGAFKVEVTRNVPVDVEIVAGEEWISVNGTKTVSTDSFWFTAQPNENVEPRVSEIHFFNREYNLVEAVYVVQLQKDALEATQTEYGIDAAGGTLTIPIGHNVAFTAEVDVDWVTLVETKAFTTDEITFNVGTNESLEQRVATITFKSSDEALEQKVTITQYGQRPSSFFDSTIPGLYSYKDEVALYQYDETTAQLSLLSGEKYAFRILDPVRLRYMEVAGMPFEMNEMDSFTVKVRHNVKDTPVEKDVEVTVVKIDGDLVWLDCSEEKRGYIICK